MCGMFVFRTCAQAFSHGWQSACPSAHRFIGLPVRQLISPSVCLPARQLIGLPVLRLICPSARQSAASPAECPELQPVAVLQGAPDVEHPGVLDVADAFLGDQLRQRQPHLAEVGREGGDPAREDLSKTA